MRELTVPHGQLTLPTFFPDATLGVVRAVDSVDLANAGIQGVVMNTFHLMQNPGSSTVQALGGLHTMCGWPHPILTDSGGFQAYSLIRQNANYGRLTNDGIHFQPDGAQRKFQLTPEKCIQLQMSYGADILMCLDDCTHVDDPAETQQLSVARTIAWAKRCRQEFDRLVKQKKLTETERPLLFGVVQGGGSKELRQECAEALLRIGFDGYGYGGWPLDANGELLTEILAYTRDLIPPEFPMHALGVGHPANIAACVAMGYGIFDSALPTRDARRGRLYTFTSENAQPSAPPSAQQPDWFRFLYLTDDKYIKSKEPISPYCDCLTCQHYSRGYLNHLYTANEAAFMRLATLHNLRFMMQLMARLGAA
ncbi:MAG: tRNA guanosine(34) transglycosylase Tgt [Caldilineaceae bacterium]|nr:tRNA guanosine(34) transglycosylase Tgt [Caldilineaceae bacterium]